MKGWALALSTDQPIQSAGGNMVAMEVRPRSPALPSPFCLSSVLWHLQNERHDMTVISLMCLGCNKSPTQGHRRGCNNCTQGCHLFAHKNGMTKQLVKQAEQQGYPNVSHVPVRFCSPASACWEQQELKSIVSSVAGWQI